MKSCLPLLLLSLVAAPMAMAAITTRIALNPDGAALRLQAAAPAGDWSAAELHLRLQAADHDEALSRLDLSQQNGVVRGICASPRVRWEFTCSPQGELLLFESVLTNLTDNELRLEPELLAIMDGSPTLQTFWNGFAARHSIGREPLTRKGIKGEVEKHVGASTMPFPVSAVYGERSSLFLGSVPFDPISYTAGGYDPARQSLSYALRLVLAPRQSLPFRLVLGSAGVRYGAQEAVVQQFYEAFPECWAVIGGQDNPYVWANHAQYNNWWGQPNPEISRRLQTRIEWCYCPYKRSGDMLGRPEFWDYRPHSTFRSGKPECGGIPIDYGSITLPDFHQHRRDRFNKLARPYGWMFYNTTAGTWCEKQLAEQHYPDAITHDKSVMYILNSWSTHHDQEIRVFPMGTSFANAFEADMTKLAAELDLPGFALDCAYGGASYRGPAVNTDLPGRAWDEEGLFIDQSVAINHQVDFIHAINREPGRQLTAFINGYLKGDYVMVEAPYLNTGKFKRWMPLLRWYIGPRPGCVHGHGFLYTELVPDWRNQTPEYFREMMPKLSDYVIMNQFKYGLTNSYLTQFGNPQQVYIFPEAFELMRAGWQAEIPMQIPADMRVPYQARYGRGVNSYFFLGNSAANEVSGTVRFDSAGLDREGWVMLFNRKLRDRAACRNRLDGPLNAIDVCLPSRVPVIYEAVLALQPNQPQLTFEVSAVKELHRQHYLFTWGDQTFSSPIRLRRLRDFRLTRVILNGLPLDVQDDRLAATLFPAGGRLELFYESEHFAVPAESITAFPYADPAGNLNFTLRLPDDSAISQRLAARFADYFAFCRERKVIPAASPDFNRVQDQGFSEPDAGTIALHFSDRSLIRSSPGGGLVLEAASLPELETLTDQLFSVMDHHFAYTFPFRWAMGLSQEILVHFKMYGKSFPVSPYFSEAR